MSCRSGEGTTHFACDCQIERMAILDRENKNLQHRIATLEMILGQCNTENRNVHDKVAKMKVLINWLKK